MGHCCYNQNSLQELYNNSSGKASLLRGGKRTGFICSLVSVVILTISYCPEDTSYYLEDKLLS